MALDTTREIRKRLHRLAVREKALTVYTGVARVLISFVMFAAVFILLDWLLSMPRAVRLFLLVGSVGGLLWIGKTYLRDPLRVFLDEEAVALRLEVRFPHLQDRLISVVQLTRSEEDMEKAGMSIALLRRLERDTAHITAPLNFSEIIDWRFIGKVTLVCAGLVLGSVAGTSRFPAYVVTGLTRMVLGNRTYPVLTQVEMLDPADRIVRGDDWTLRVNVTGRIPYAVTLYTRTIGGSRRWQATEMRPELGRTYALTVEKVHESFEYAVEAGDAHTPPKRVEVLVPVAIEDPVVRVTPPAYTGLEQIREVSVREAEVPQGSEVEFIVPATKPVVAGQVVPEEGDPVELSPLGGGRGASGSVVVYEPMSFSIVLRDADGLTNPEPRTVYRLRVRPDYPPKAVITAPKDDRTSVAIAEWKILYRLSDDFGVRRAWLVWRVDEPSKNGNGETASADGVPEAPPARAGRDEIAVPAGGETGAAVLSMLSKRVAVGDLLTVWVEAADVLEGVAPASPGMESHVGRSPSLRFRIVGEDEKWAEIDARMKEAEKEIVEIYDGEKELKGTVDLTKDALEPKGETQ